MPGAYHRFAVCWHPPADTALAEFGRAWTGWCAERGEIARPWRGWPVEIRQGGPAYGLLGLTAMLRAPFALAVRRSHWALERLLDEIAVDARIVRLPRLGFDVTDGRLHLRTAAAAPDVDRLAGRIATGVRLMQSVPGPVRLAPRRPVPGGAGPASAPRRLTIPLTGRIGADRAQALQDDLAPVLEPVLAERHVLADLALMGDPGFGRPWRLLERYRLGAGRGMPAGSLACYGTTPPPPLHTLMGPGWHVVIG